MYAAVFVVVNVHEVNEILSQDSVCQLKSCARAGSVFGPATFWRLMLPRAFGSINVKLLICDRFMLGNVNSKVTLPIDRE